VVALVRTLRPRASPMVAVLVVALAIASRARDMDFAAFRQPCFWASFYNVADALRLLAIVLVLRGRPVLGAALLAGSFASHPAMGLMGGLFIAASFAARPRELLQRRLLAGALLFLLAAGLWAVLVLGVGTASGAEFPPRLWFGLTRLFSHHWHPIAEGMLTTKHEAAFLPFLSFLVLLGYFLGRAAPLGELDRKAAAGMGGMLAVTALGLVLTLVPVTPALTKLALHRANDLVLTVGLVYVVAGLWDECAARPAWRPLVAAVALASPFFSRPGFPLLASVLLAAPACLGRRGTPGRLWALAPVAASGAIMAFYIATGTAGRFDEPAYTGLSWLATAPVLIGASLFLLALLTRAGAGRLARPLLVAALAGAAVHWQAASRLSPDVRAWSLAYKNAQLWARDHTARDALFLVDPGIFLPTTGYGWRDYSRRSSFGSPREWLYLSWHYTSDYRLCQEGLRRLGEFHVDLSQYLGQSPPPVAAAALIAEVQRQYHSASEDWLLGLARRHRIGYFVSKRPCPAGASRLPVVYENEFFLIHAATEPAK
jgi:hypothetical protein